MIHLRMLGEIRLTSASGEELDSLLRQPKRLALLAYLASPTPGTWHRRDMILALFWPELDLSRARTSLRNGLYVIRQTLGEEIVRNRGDEEISVDSALLSTDVAAVWDSLRNGKTDAALAQYGGDLLPGLFPPDSAGFERWLDAERTRLRVVIAKSGVERLNELERTGNLSDAVTVGRRLLEIQPDDETIVRRAMTLYETMGDRAGALAVFESYRIRLANDFEAEPSSETLALVAKLRAANPQPAKRAPATQAAHASTVIAERAGEPEKISTPRRNFYGAAILAVLLAAGYLVFANWGSAQLPALGRSAPLTTEEGLQVEAAISPNGRLVAFARGNASMLRIFVQKIGGGQAWPLSPDSDAVQVVPRWSPNNDEILFLSHNSAYASPSIGGAARLIARGSEGDGMIRSASWSPTGDSVAIVRNDSLFVKGLEGPRQRFVGTAPQLHSCVWSPNGMSIACVAGNVLAFTPGPLFGNEAPSSIVLFPAMGGKPRDLTGNNYEHKSPAWSSDGKFLWFLSNRDGVSGEAYAVEIDRAGKKDRVPVRMGIRAEWISLSTDRIAYSIPSKKANIWTVPIPGDAAVDLSAAKQLTFGSQVIEILSISRDRKWLAYDSNLSGNSDIYRMPLDGARAERLTDDPRPEYAPELSPNSGEIAWQKWIDGARHLFVKSLDSDSLVEVTVAPPQVTAPHWSPDGQTLLAWSHVKERGGVFTVRRGADGKWASDWRLDYGQSNAWSPDGRTVAFVLLDGSVQTMPADSGAAHTVYKPRVGSEDPLALYIVWTEPTRLWVMAAAPDGKPGIWEIAIPTGRPKLRVKLNLAEGQSYGPAFASDGSRFYFTLVERSSNILWTELRKR